LKILIFCILALVSLRLYTFHEPLERDITTYSVIANEMLNGRALYSELWDHKPPLLYYSYLVSQVLFGYNELSVFILNIGSSILSLIAIFLVTRILNGDSRFSCLVWTVLSGSLGIEGNQPNVEVFINASLLWGLYFSLSSKNFLAGISFVAASLYKQIAILFPFFILPILYLCFKKKEILLKTILLGITTWGVTFLAYGDPFFKCVFVYNSSYAGSLIDNLLKGFVSLTPAFATALLPCSIAALCGLYFSENKVRILLLGILVSAFFMFSLPGKFYPHYYQLFLPFICLAVGSAPKVLAIASLLFTVLLEAPNYILTPDDWSVKKYGEVFLRSKEMGLKLKSALPPETLLYQFGAETGLYFYSKLSPVSGVFYDYPLMYGPFKEELSKRVERDLIGEIVVINRSLSGCNHSEDLSEPGFKVYICKR